MAPTFGLKLPLGDGRLASRLQDPSNDELSGRALASDPFTPITVNPQRLTPTSAPFMYLSMAPIPSPIPLGIFGTFSLGSGSVWIAAKQFAPDAPDSSYFGLQIDSGGMRFSNLLFNTGDPFAQVSLTLTSTPTAGVLRDASVTVPINVEFQFNLSNATLLSASNSNVNIWGTPVVLQFQSGQAFMDTTFDRLNFPFLPTVSSFQAIQSTSSLAKFSGTAPIHGGSWCLPLTITSTATFGEASGGGGMSIILDPGISVVPLDRNNATACGVFSCLVEPNLFNVQGASATTSTLPQIITLPLGGGMVSTPRQPQSTLTLRTSDSSPFQYTAQIDGTEGWAIFISVSASLDKPRTISGARVLMGGQAALNLIQNGPTGPITATIQAGITDEDNFQSRSQSQTFALKNLLLRTGTQTSLNVTGIYVGGSMTAGTLAFTSALLFVHPFLPDPYTTNISNATNIDGSLGDMTINVTWDADPTHEPIFDLSLPPSALRRVGVVSTDQQIGQFQQNLIQQNLALTPEGPILLDLSTNVSQFGVSFSTDQQENPIADLSLQGQATNVQVFALPAVQWEPMVAQPSGDIYNFIYSGPPTMVASNSVTLVPVAPREAMDEILNSYTTSTSIVVTTTFSLPFGLVAAATLQHSPLVSQPSLEVLSVKPVFQSPPAIGGDQISLRVVPSIFLGTTSPTSSLTLPGNSTALSAVNVNRSDPSLPGASGVSAIDIDSSSTFISASYNSAFISSVPINRVDLSGFGESIFSEWQTGTTDQIGITKVSFDVMVGRAAREVIQVRSVMAPYAHRVIRTITIDRLNNGIVVRSDSGWQRITDGTYDFPVNLTHPIVTHPGVVTKATNVRNIRDIIDPKTPGLVNFDCTLILENSLGSVETPAINQLGFVYEGDSMGNPATFLPTDYAAILAKAPLGGPVDVNIDIGGSGMQMRITKISVAATSTLNAQGDPEFCVAANGAPVLPGGGQWSFIRTTPLLASTPVDKDQGVPLTRRGPHTSPIPLANPYKFADPSDILSDVAQINYGILHATDSHRTLFSNPIISVEATIKSITSELLPNGGLPSIYIADPFALGSSSSIFPDLGNCIPLTNEATSAIYNLKILAENNLHLDDIQNFTLPAATRILQGDDNFKSAILTAGTITDAVPASVNLLLNSAEKTWNMDVSKLSMLNLGQGGAEISRIAGSIQSAESQLMAFGSGLASDLSQVPQLIFGAALQEVQKVVAFLSSLGVLPALKVAMTNTWALTVSTSMGLDEFLAKIPPGARDVVADIITQFDLALKAVTSLTSADFKFTLKLGVKVPTSFGPTALGIAGFSLDVGTSSGVAVRLDLGVGIGVGFDAGPFHALGYFGYTQSVYKASNAWGLGSTATVKAHVDLVVASADLCIEATIALVSGTCGNGDEESTIWGYAQVTIAIDVSIFWVVNVHVHEHAEWNNRFKGHCELADLTHGI